MTIHDQDDVRLLKPTREIWSEAQKTLVKKMSQPSFESWIRPSQLIDYNKGIALIAVSNDFVQTMIANHYMEALAQAIGEVTQEKVTIKVVVDANAQSESYSATIASITSSQGNT